MEQDMYKHNLSTSSSKRTLTFLGKLLVLLVLMLSFLVSVSPQYLYI